MTLDGKNTNVLASFTEIFSSPLIPIEATEYMDISHMDYEALEVPLHLYILNCSSMAGFSMLNAQCLILSHMNSGSPLSLFSTNSGLHFRPFANLLGLMAAGIK